MDLMLQQKPRGKVERGRRLLKSATENCVVFFLGGQFFGRNFGNLANQNKKGDDSKKHPLTQNVPKRLR